MRTTERVLILVVLAAAGGLVLAARPPAAGAQAGGAPARIAVCDVYRVSDRLMKSERFQPVIEQEQLRLQEQLDPLEKDLSQRQDVLRELDRDDPSAAAQFSEYQAREREYLGLRQRLRAEFERFVASQNMEAYRLVVASTEAVADQKGYTWVFAARDKIDEAMPETAQQFVQGLLARPVIKCPPEDDLTEDVLAELKLE